MKGADNIDAASSSRKAASPAANASSLPLLKALCPSTIIVAMLPGPSSSGIASG